MRQRCLGAVGFAPNGAGAAIGTLAVDAGLSTAAPEHDDGDVGTQTFAAVIEIDQPEAVSNVPSSLKLVTDAKLENDKEAFAFALHEQAQPPEQDQELGVEQAEFLLAIGLGLPRGP